MSHCRTLFQRIEHGECRQAVCSDRIHLQPSPFDNSATSHCSVRPPNATTLPPCSVTSSPYASHHPVPDPGVSSNLHCPAFASQHESAAHSLNYRAFDPRQRTAVRFDRVDPPPWPSSLESPAHLRRRGEFRSSRPTVGEGVSSATPSATHRVWPVSVMHCWRMQSVSLVAGKVGRGSLYYVERCCELFS